MVIPWKNRIGVKLFGILSVVIALGMIPLAYVVLVSVNTFGVYSATINKDQIKQQAFSYLSHLSKEHGLKYEEYFKRVSTTATFLATQASHVYNNIDSFAQMTGSSPELYWQEENEMFLSPKNISVVTAYWDNSTILPEINIELQALVQLEPFLEKTKELLPDSQATHMISVSGIGKYLTLSEKAKEVVRHLPKKTTFDLRDGAPLTIFTKEKRSTETSQWTGIYKDDVLEGLMMTASGPIVDKDGVLRGIAGVDIPLQTIVEDVLTDSNVSLKDGGQILFSFLVDASGRLIAFPQDYMDLFGFDIDLSQLQHSSDLLQKNLMDSQEKEVLLIARQILAGKTSILELVLNEEKYIIATSTLPELGWKFSLVTREADLISSIQRTQKALQGTLKGLKREFAVNSLITAVITLLLVYFAVRYFVGPLQKLSILAKQVGEGNLAAKYNLNRGDEIGALGQSMNLMIEKLALAGEMKENYSRQLEGDIRKRTRVLKLQNLELEGVVAKLHAESKARKDITLALVESEKQLRFLMASSLAGICIIQKGTFKYVNPAIVNLFGYSHSEFIGGIGPTELIVPEQQKVVQDRLARREEGKYIKPEPPYNIRCIAKGGRVFDALIDEAKITWEGEPASAGTIVDISRLKKVEKELREKKKILRVSLEEKDILLKEVYHRTKNNMLVIISMLALQMDGIKDERAREIFVETENRIRAMALVHENLYRSQNLSEINLGEYLGNMVRTLVASMTLGDKIEVFVQCCDCAISFEQAIPIGLIVNELVTNSVKHAFPGESSGEVRLEIKKSGQEIELIVADNGIGLPAKIDVYNSSTFGLQITANMIEKQLHGSFQVSRAEGTEYIINLTGLNS